jgi:dodecin
MSVARVTELSAISDKSFEDAINQAVSRATKTLRGVEGCWVKDMNVMIEDGNITGYKVNVEITFVLEDAQGGTSQDASDEAVAHTTGQDAPLTPGQEPIQ